MCVCVYTLKKDKRRHEDFLATKLVHCDFFSFGFFAFGVAAPTTTTTTTSILVPTNNIFLKDSHTNRKTTTTTTTTIVWVRVRQGDHDKKG